MEMYALSRYGVPVGVSGSGMAVKFVLFQTVLLITGAVLWMTHADFVREYAPNSWWFILLGYAATAAFFSLFFGGNLGDCLSAALCGLTVGLCLLYGRRITGSNTFFRTAVCAAAAAGMALLMVRFGLGQDVDAITIGTLMLLVPGMALTNAMREIMAGDIVSGLYRTAEVILIGIAIAIGTAVPLLFSNLY